VFSWPEFGQPAWLLLLPVVPLLVGWWSLRKSAAVYFSDTRGLSAINSRRAGLARWCGGLGRILALSALVIALAGPRWPDPGNRLPTEGIAILLVIDVSGSTNEMDFEWCDLQTLLTRAREARQPVRPTDGTNRRRRWITRWQAMQRGFQRFVAGGDGPHGETLPGRPNDLIGLVVFAGTPRTTCPLTLSHDTLLQLLAREEPGKGGNDPDTQIGDAIAWSVHRLNASPMRQKVMVLVTDGEQWKPPVLKPRQAAQFAGHFGIPVYTVDVGNDDVTLGNPPDPKVAAKSRLDAKTTLQEVAKMTGGQYYSAPDGKGLLDACSKLSDDLDRRDREQIETFRYRHHVEGFAWFAGSALVMLVVLLALELTVWRRYP
jgi:Ca-activated chloride channel family protein